MEKSQNVPENAVIEKNPIKQGLPAIMKKIIDCFNRHYGESVELVLDRNVTAIITSSRGETVKDKNISVFPPDHCVKQHGVQVYQSLVPIGCLLSDSPHQPHMHFLADILEIVLESQTNSVQEEGICVDFPTSGNGFHHIYQDLIMASLTDPLTGILNRRGALFKIRKYLSTGELNLSILMVDVDHFKNVNDLFGHSVGDRVLKRIAGILKDACRVTDVVCRWGGDEFVIMLPNCSQEDATSVAESMRGSVEAKSSSDWRSGCTVSIGLAAMLVTSEGEVNMLLERADSALYQSKRNGKNRITVGTAVNLKAPCLKE